MSIKDMSRVESDFHAAYHYHLCRSVLPSNVTTKGYGRVAQGHYVLRQHRKEWCQAGRTPILPLFLYNNASCVKVEQVRLASENQEEPSYLWFL